MANTVTIRNLVDGENVGYAHIYIASDGSSGELTDTVVLDASALAGATPIKEIDEVTWDLIGFTAKLEFDQTTDSTIILMQGSESICFDHPVTNPQGTGTTGDVVITTTGFASAGDEGVITIRYRK